MVTVRRSVFETNSSSTHSITICSKKQFDDWMAGKCFFNVDTEKFVVPDMSHIEEYKNEAVEQYKRLKDNDPYSVSWAMLASEDQQRYIDAHVKYRLEQERDNYNCLSYDGYKLYHKEGCEYTEKFFTTEHGDEVAAFGKGGWN